MIRRKAALTLAIGLFAVACLVAGSTQAFAEASDRGEKWQFYVPITYFSGEKIDGEQGSFAELSSDIGWGFAFGYNFNERFMVGFEITWLNASYDARVIEDTDGNGTPDATVDVSGQLDSSSLQLVGQYNFMETRVTPFIKASLGSTYTDSNIASGPPSTGCWWVWPWGYVCSTYVPTYDKNSFSYGGAIGVRADLGDAFYLELSYNQFWIDFSSASSTPSFSGGRLNMGWIF